MKNRVVEYLQLLLAFLSTTTAELLLYSDLDAPSGVGNPPSAVELYETTPLTGRKLSGVNTTKHENPPPQSHPNTNAHADVSPDETAHVSGGGASSGGSSGGASSGASTTSSSSGSSTSGGNGDNASGGGSGDSAASAGDHRPPNGSRYQSSRSLWGFLVAAAVLSVGLASLTFRKRDTKVDHALKGSVGRRMQLFNGFAKHSPVPRPERRMESAEATDYYPAPNGRGPVEV